MYLDFINDRATCCGELPIVPTDIFWEESILTIKDDIIQIFNKAITELVFAEQKTSGLDLLFDLSMLFTYLHIVDEDRQLDLIGGTTYTESHYYDEYGFHKLLRYFNCYGINIYPILEIWGFDNSSDLTAGVGSQGIDSEINPLTVQ